MGTLLVGWAFMAAFWFVFIRGYETDDPARAAGFAYRKQASGPFGLLPPSVEPIGLVLWGIVALGFVGGIVSVIVDGYVGLSSAVMLGGFLANLWRENRWMKQQSGYKAALAEAKRAP